jgi:membrane-associated protease RseP (regulator of RpoE activity)
LLLFLLTIFTTILAGIEWIFGRAILDAEQLSLGAWLEPRHWLEGGKYAFALLGALTVHEFGHYFAAQYYRIKVTLPYYIPFWFFGVLFSIGTMGAFIRIKSPLASRKQFFDIGIAGPLAGLLVGFGVLWYAYTHLPEADYPQKMHAEAGQLAEIEEGKSTYFVVGKNLLILAFERYVVPEADKAKIPEAKEVHHYPFLFAGYLILLFTVLNLMPIGQLDGGHILYGLLGKRLFNTISPLLFMIFVFYAGLGLVPLQTEELSELLLRLTFYAFFLFFTFRRVANGAGNAWLVSLLIIALQLATSFLFPEAKGYSGWLAFAFILGRILGVYHPAAQHEAPLGWGRKLLGWLTLILFILCFSPYPIEIVLPEE